MSLFSVISLVTLHVGGIRLELPVEGSISRLQALWSEKAAGEGREEVGGGGGHMNRRRERKAVSGP